MHLSVLVLVTLLVCLLTTLRLSLYFRHLRLNNYTRRLDILSGLSLSEPSRRRLLGFFHPYCNAGGGGERVLWTAISALQRAEPDVVSIVYSGDIDVSKEQIIAKVQARFNILLDPSTIHFVFLNSRWLVEDATWHHFTLLGQSMGSMYLAWEAMSKLVPDLYIDTMGYAFTFHVIAMLSQIPVVAYIHYPTISTDMVARVKDRNLGPTNSRRVSNSLILSQFKLLYYRIFMYYYSRSLRAAHFLMVNSTWTKIHIETLLQYEDALVQALQFFPPFCIFYILTRRRLHSPSLKTVQTVYPPCDTREMQHFSLENRERLILSVAQFRPEKNHACQLFAFSRLLNSHPEYAEKNGSVIKLVLLGGCRNVDDEKRIESLRCLARDLDIQDYVHFVVNAEYSEMLHWLSRASIGLSTMIDEHFGINVVELMAAGIIPIAHASGGPMMDIVVPINGEQTGYRAKSVDDVAAAIHTILTLHSEEDFALRKRARMWAVQRFSRDEFEKSWNGSGWRALLFR